MRNTFIAALTERAATDERIMLLTGDLGFRVVERFQERFPGRYLNGGIAEQDLIEVAAGLALEGYKPFVYSIASFPTLRCLEQIRNSVCNPELDVTVICIGGGFAYGQLGMTHHATEDMAAMRSMPCMEVLSPADPAEARAVAAYCFESTSPKYVRINRGGEPELEGAERVEGLPVQGLRGLVERARRAPAGVEGAAGAADVAIVATGAIAKEALEAADLLAQAGISCEVFTAPLVKPLDAEGIRAVAARTKLVATLEEHTVIGGLGSAVAEAIEDARVDGAHGLAPVLRIGIPDRFPDVVGDQRYLRQRFSMDAEGVTRRIREALGRA